MGFTATTSNISRLITIVAAGVLLAAPAAADAELSTARAELEARRAVAPLQVESIACFRATPVTRRRPRVDRQFCVVQSPAAPGERCISTVVVARRSRPRRVRARVTIPLRCFPAPAPLGSQDAR